MEPKAPVLCLLDPEGFDLDWSTIEALSRFRTGRFKTEIIVLFDIEGLARVLPLWPTSAWAPERLDGLFGTGAWRNVWTRRQQGLIDRDAAISEYVGLYVSQLETLGYGWVLNREIHERGREGRLKYFLLFATDNETGRTIMDHCFGIDPGGQASLPGLAQPLSRQLPRPR